MAIWKYKYDPKGNGGSLRRFYRSRERFIHVSAEAGMRPQANADGTITMVLWVQRPGRTYRRHA